MEQLEDKGYGWRLLAVTLAGAAGALLLTWFMHQLIHSSQQRLDESSRAHLVDFVRLKRDEASQRKDLKPDKPTQAQAPDAPAPPQADSNQADTTLAVSDTALPDGLGLDLKIGGLGFDGADGEYLPIVKIAPIYPPRAHARGIQGDCVVIFTVTTTGTTRDVKVVEELCDHEIFYKSSISAAKRFKYKPRIIGGEAVEVHNVRNRLMFRIENGY
jgi:protein TonB